MHKFNRDKEMELIAAVKKRRPLWDPSTPLHKSVKVLVYLWKQVAQELKMDETTVRRKWKNIRDYFIRQAKELEKSNDRKDGSESDDLVSYKFCLWPLYEKLKFLTDQAQTPLTQRVKLTDDDYKILDEINDNTLQGNSDATETIETIIYHVPNGEGSNGDVDGDDSDDCQLVSVQAVQTIPESHTSKTAASISAVASSTIELSQVSGLSQTIGFSQYLPPPLKKIAPTVQSKQQLTQPKVIQITQKLPKLPVLKKVQKITKVQPKQQVAKDQPKLHEIIQLSQELSKLPGQTKLQQITKEQPKQQVTKVQLKQQKTNEQTKQQQVTKKQPKQHQVIQLTHELPELPGHQQVIKKQLEPPAQQVTKEQPIEQPQQKTKEQSKQQEQLIYIAKHQPVQFTRQGQQIQQNIVIEAFPQSLRPNLLQLFEKNPSLKTMLTATNPPPLCKIPPLKRATLTLNEEQNNDQPVVIPITTTCTTKRAKLTLHDEQDEDQPVTISHTTTAITSETNDDKNDADYQFFKSLLPFMNELPMKNRLRIRNYIQLLVLKEFESIEREEKLDRFSNKELCNNDEQTIELDSSPCSGEGSNGHSSVNVKEEDVEMTENTEVLYEIKKETV